MRNSSSERHPPNSRCQKPHLRLLSKMRVLPIRMAMSEITVASGIPIWGNVSTKTPLCSDSVQARKRRPASSALLQNGLLVTAASFVVFE